MDIDDFVTQFDSNPLCSIPQQLNIRPTLARILFMHREMAEQEGIEYGRNLFLEGGQIVTGPTMKGDQTSVQMDNTTAATFPEYIGDFHVHPYRRKMADGVSIGFSTGDIDTYTATKQLNGQISLLRFHMVVAGPKVWLIVMYPWTQLKPVGSPEGDTDVQTSLLFLGQSEARFNRWHDGVSAMNDLPGLDDKIAAERLMWQDIPEYPAVFAKANKTMNRNLAKFHKYGLYIGKFGERTGETLLAVPLSRKDSN
jgi:hypothetical protein